MGLENVPNVTTGCVGIAFRRDRGKRDGNNTGVLQGEATRTASLATLVEGEDPGKLLKRYKGGWGEQKKGQLFCRVGGAEMIRYRRRMHNAK